MLDERVPEKTPFLEPKREISPRLLLDEDGRDVYTWTARELLRLRDSEKALTAEILREKQRIEALSPWRSCPLPLDCPGTKAAAVTFGSLPASADTDALSAALLETVGAAELFPVGADDAARYLYVIYLRSAGEQTLRLLREYGFAAPGFGEASGTAAEGIAAAEAKVKQLETQRTEINGQILSYAMKRGELRRLYDQAEAKVQQAEAAGKLLRTDSTLLLEGWSRADREQKVTELLERFGCAYEFADPVEEEYDSVPVQLENNKLTDGLNMVTNMYSLPRYGSVDPNPLMAPFFILFYGIMMADMGYGIVMLLIGLLITLKKRPKEGFLKYFGELMIEGGVATFIMVILTGGFFGDAPKWFVNLLTHGNWAGLPALIDPLNNTVSVLIGALILGFIHLNAGMVISFYMKVRDGKLMDGLADEGSMWVFFICLACTVLGLGIVPLIIGLVAFAWGKAHSAEGVVGKVMAVFSGVYSEATGWFGDILSYARLMALMLAGSVIAQVFNTLGAMPGNIFVFILICIFGNTLNFGLNLLGCYVHDLRLQCLEFFNKFYVAGGKPFRPLKLRSKFFEVSD